MSDRITVIRAPRDGAHAYFAISRALAQDERLTFEARGILAYLLSKPGDWEVRPDDLQRAGNCGRDRIYRILKELRAAGYLHRDRVHQANGTFKWGPYRVYEVPFTENPEMATPHADAAQPFPEKPDTVLPDTENTEMVKPSIPHQDAAQPFPPLPYTENTDIYIDKRSTDQRILQRREGASPAPAPDASRGVTDPNQTHPASLAYREITGYRPAKAHAATIAARVARDAASLDRWRVAVEAWIGRGNRYTNVDGMVEWYELGVPVQPARARGASPQTTRTPLAPPTKPNLPDQPISAADLAARAAQQRRSK